jgi:hypothetical protein
MKELLADWRKEIHKFLREQTKQWHHTDVSIVDIGVGESVNVLKPIFPKLELVDYARRNDVHRFDICDTVPENLRGKFQIVTCCEVLEHVKDPFAAARNTIILAQPGGLILVTAPCHIFWHEMPPLCGDYWRFFQSAIPLLFNEDCKIIKLQSHYKQPKQPQDMPLGITAAIRRI